MFGSPTPTKQTRWPASSRAAATIIISDLEKAESVTDGPRRARARRCGTRWTDRRPGPGSARPPSAVLPVVHRRGRRWTGLERRDPLRPQLLDIRGPAIQGVDPVPQPGLERVLVLRDRVPVEVEAVVAVVSALDVRGMRPVRLHDDGIDDEARNDGAVRIGPDDRLVDELLHDDDDPL